MFNTSSVSPHDSGGGSGHSPPPSSSVDNRRGEREKTPPGEPCSLICRPRNCSTLPHTLSNETSPESTPTKSRRGKMFGLRGLVKMFRRKVRRRVSSSSSEMGSKRVEDDSRGQCKKGGGEAIRARSASELLRNSVNRSSIGQYPQGMSVSHDSVFSPDSTPSDHNSQHSPMSQPLSSMGVNMNELKAVLQRRVGSGHSLLSTKGMDDSGDDDPGLPRSPPTSPNAGDNPRYRLKSVSRATQSTCSDASLLSMGSSELEDDSAGSLHSSKHSLGDIKHHHHHPLVVDHEPVAGEAPGLSHNAARHKMAVRPRRTHERTRTRRPLQQVQSSSVLPTTLEVSEESSMTTSSTPLRSLSTSQITRPVSYEPSNPQPSQPLSMQPSNQQLPYNAVQSTLSQVINSDKDGVTSVVLRSNSRSKLHQQEVLRGKYMSSPHELSRGASCERPTDKNEVLRVHVSPYSDRQSVGSKDLKKAKSFREGAKFSHNVVRRESSRRSWFGGSPYQNTDAGVKHSASYDCLETNLNCSINTTQTVVALVDEQQNKLDQKILSSNMSSTDSLTTTEIPGVYIRPLSQYKKSSEDIVSAAEYQRQSVVSDNSYGPLSLDSSISLIPHPDEENFRQTNSEHSLVSSFIPSTSAYLKESSTMAESISFPATSNIISKESMKYNPSGNYVTEINLSDNQLPPPKETPTTLLPGPASVLRSVSLSTSDNSGAYAVLNRRSSSADELEKNEKISHSKESNQTQVIPRLKKTDKSFSRQSSENNPAEVVPEFMRIQLNKVENKPQRVIFATEQQTEKIITPAEPVAKEEETTTTTTTTTEKLPPPPNRRASTHCSVLEEVRKPLRREKSLIIEKSSASKTEETPELMKVFARRSFKVKETFGVAQNTEEMNEFNKENIEENVNSIGLSSPMSGITKINPIYSTPTPPISPKLQAKFTTDTLLGSGGEMCVGNIAADISSKNQLPKPQNQVIRNNSSSPVNSPDAPSSTKINIRPMCLNKESVQSDSFNSAIVNRAKQESSESKALKSNDTAIDRPVRNIFKSQDQNSVATHKSEQNSTSSERESEGNLSEESSESDAVKRQSSSEDEIPQVKSVRKKFMSPKQASPEASSSVIEARNIAPAFTVTVRNNPHPYSPARSKSAHHRHSIGGISAPSHLARQHHPSASPPPSFRRCISHHTEEDKSEGGQDSAEDWRVLARQRRKERLEQTKSTEGELPMDARVNTRSSKVLEMASNFQKLQVA